MQAEAEADVDEWLQTYAPEKKVLISIQFAATRFGSREQHGAACASFYVLG